MSSRIRSLDEVMAVLRIIREFRLLGFDPFPLKRFNSLNAQTGKPNGNTPRDIGWQHIDYSHFDFGAWLATGGNYGWRLGANQLILDVDPRNGGDVGLSALQWDIDDQAIDDVPYVLSGRGDGGKHLYFNKPPTVRTLIQVSGYRGLDFKRGPGGYLLAPGALHYKTGKPYAVGHIAFDRIPDAPTRLIELIADQRKSPNASRSGVGGEITPAKLAELLLLLDPEDFGGEGNHDRWVQLLAACHDATNGEGMHEFQDWCCRDDRYVADRELVGARWSSFSAGITGGATFRTLFRAVIDAGHAHAIADNSHITIDPDYPDLLLPGADETRPAIDIDYSTKPLKD